MPAWNVVCSIIDLNDAKETFVLTLKYWCNGKANQDCSNKIKWILVISDMPAFFDTCRKVSNAMCFVMYKWKWIYVDKIC